MKKYLIFLSRCPTHFARWHGYQTYCRNRLFRAQNLVAAQMDKRGGNCSHQTSLILMETMNDIRRIMHA